VIACLDKTHDRVVLRRNVSFSAFNGYRSAWSASSLVHCKTCQKTWRSKGKYVDDLPDGAIAGFVPWD